MTEMEQQDQTLFSSTQPLFDAQLNVADQSEQVPSKKPKKIVVLGIVVGLAFIFILVMLAILTAKPKRAVNQESEPSPTPTADLVTDPVFDRLNQLKDDLDHADPTNRDLPFPPVNMQIGFDKNISN